MSLMVNSAARISRFLIDPDVDIDPAFGAAMLAEIPFPPRLPP